MICLYFINFIGDICERMLIDRCYKSVITFRCSITFNKILYDYFRAASADTELTCCTKYMYNFPRYQKKRVEIEGVP